MCIVLFGQDWSTRVKSDIKVNRAFLVPKTRYGEGRGKAQHQKQKVLTKK
jgi:hypothetical protein